MNPSTIAGLLDDRLKTVQRFHCCGGLSDITDEALPQSSVPPSPAPLPDQCTEADELAPHSD